MITAMMMTNDKISNHFTKAEYLLLVNESGQVVKNYPNPVILGGEGCAMKDKLLALIVTQANRVVVSNIGQRFLKKLLDKSLQVVKTQKNKLSLEEVMLSITQMENITNVAQGRDSVNYNKKQQEGGCRCSHNNTENQTNKSATGGCHGKNNDNIQHKPCCEK
ncbi:MAG: NifB/NifX family molybdenum-iron cluster-binding protein [Colwellia sp.]